MRRDAQAIERTLPTRRMADNRIRCDAGAVMWDVRTVANEKGPENRALFFVFFATSSSS
jgi:hypothetical protein